MNQDHWQKGMKQTNKNPNKTKIVRTMCREATVTHSKGRPMKNGAMDIVLSRALANQYNMVRSLKSW